MDFILALRFPRQAVSIQLEFNFGQITTEDKGKTGLECKKVRFYHKGKQKVFQVMNKCH